MKDSIYENVSTIYYLGIDGGGTKTAFRLVDENGRTVSDVRRGTSNPNDIGMERALSVLEEGIREACRGIPFSKITLFAGIAGGGLSGGNARILRRFFEGFSFFAFENGSDVENLAALSDEETRILVIMGTGFIVYAIHGAEKKRISGWGQLFDDGGSGYTLGRDAIAAVLAAGDGSGRQTLLTAFLEEQVGESAEDHLTVFYQRGKAYIAEFASLVFEAAERGDAVAREILEKNTRFTAKKIRAALAFLVEKSDCVIPVLFAGGISRRSKTLFPLIETHLGDTKHRLIRLDDEPVDGAINRARQIYKTKIKESEAYETNSRG